ncbi:MAG TPA: 3D domain-containing protein [Vicinamibacterales bacterium]|nr:3D domain-containing protein [Vicinamibacterales bacterium]
MRIADSYWRKAAATLCVATVFVLLYEIQTRDSKSEASADAVADPNVVPQAGARLQFQATAYCKGETTASGVGVRTGIAAADPAVLPVGSVVRLETPNPRYSGVWTVMDTGPAVRGRMVDLYLWSCKEALQFGRRNVRLTVLRLGWSPENSIPGIVDTLFRKREAAATKAVPQTAAPRAGTSSREGGAAAGSKQDN